MHWDMGRPRNPFGKTSMPDYEELITILRAENAALKEQLAAKDELVEAYRAAREAEKAYFDACAFGSRYDAPSPDRLKIKMESARARVAELEGKDG